jgi:hypothetical protein
LYYLIKSPIQCEFVSGTLIEANEAALMTISLTDILDLATVLSLALNLIKLST